MESAAWQEAGRRALLPGTFSGVTQLADRLTMRAQEYFALIESLSQVKSVVLVADLPNAEEMLVDIFRNFIDGVRPNGSKKLERLMVDILVQLIEESSTVPNEVIETLLAQFREACVVREIWLLLCMSVPARQRLSLHLEIRSLQI